MKFQLLDLPAKAFLGKGIDKKLPFLVVAYKSVFSRLQKDGVTEVKIPKNIRMLVSNKDAGLGMYLRTKKVFEPLQTRLFLRTVKKNNIVFDIGANVGYYTLLASKKVGNRGKVYSFEPDPRNLILLKENVIRNNCTNVVIMPVALSRKTGRARFTQDPANPGESGLGKKKGKKIFVQTKTLTSCVKTFGVKRIDVIKMDIEGGEVDALSGGKTALSKMKKGTLFIEYNPTSLIMTGYKPETLLRIIKSCGFRVRRIINEFHASSLPFSRVTLLYLMKNTSYVTLIGKKGGRK